MYGVISFRRLSVCSRNLCRSKGLLEVVIQPGPSRLYSSTFYPCVQIRIKGETDRVNYINCNDEERKEKKSEKDVNGNGEKHRTVERKPTSWVEHKAIPSWMKPYLRLARADKQVGTALLFWPCLWSISLATPIGTLPDLFLTLKFATGAIIMRSAGCVINDIWDR